MTETAPDTAASQPQETGPTAGQGAGVEGEGQSGPQAGTSQAGSSEGGLEVVYFPDPVLRRETQPVREFGPALRATAEAMLARMFESRGVGLAAPQVGLSQRLFVYNPEGDPERAELSRVMVNPTITARAGKRVKHEEGCLSLPHIYAEIERPDRCTVEFCDLDGAAHVEEFDGFVSRIVQHEYDHIEGVLIVDRMTPADKARHRAALEELRAQYRDAQAGGGASARR
ncbi:MAG: peptide deformylase [Planctomycetota bacterium]